VAGFIGSPAMNFFEARIDRSDGDLIVDTKTFNIKVPESRVKAYEPHTGNQVIFGIRPDDIHDPAYTPPDIQAAPVEATVDVTELMGNEIFMHLEMGESSAVGRIDPRTKLRVGDQAQLVFNVDNMHLFESTGDQKAIQ
jgi:multiple sugar transport system ATP-binding protein